jgi:hypothetical protein
MKPWGFNILSALSLALCLGTAVLWARSTFRTQFLCCNRCDVSGMVGDHVTEHHACFWLCQSNGRIVFQYSQDVWTVIRAGGVVSLPLPAGTQWFYGSGNGGGFSFQQIQGKPFLGTAQNRVRDFKIESPHWAVVAAASIVPLCWLFSRWNRRPRAGLCANCGYDLRASPDRCPECGVVSVKV